MNIVNTWEPLFYLELTNTVLAVVAAEPIEVVRVAGWILCSAVFTAVL